MATRELLVDLPDAFIFVSRRSWVGNRKEGHWEIMETINHYEELSKLDRNTRNSTRKSI